MTRSWISGLFWAAIVSLVAIGLVTLQPDPTIVSALSTVSAFPATPAFCNGIYRGDTSDGVRLLSYYGCRPDWPETGPEHFYSLHLTSSQPVTLTLSHPVEPGLDLDLFLLTGSGATSCVYADATLHATDLAAGDYTIVVDGFNASSGPYQLQVDCTEAPFATSTPTTTALPTFTPTVTLSPSPTTVPTVTPTRSALTYFSYLPSQQEHFPPPTPQPTTIVLQESVIDTYISAWENNTAYDMVDRLALRQPDVMAPLLSFSLSRLPANAYIVEARLGLWALNRSNSNPATVGAFRINRPWQARQTTWLHVSPDQSWAIPGANGTPTDRESSPRSTQIVQTAPAWHEWNITALVQEWLRDPKNNFGIILKANAEPRVLYQFASAEYGNPEARPKLTIRFWTPTPSPPRLNH